MLHNLLMILCTIHHTGIKDIVTVLFNFKHEVFVKYIRSNDMERERTLSAYMQLVQVPAQCLLSCLLDGCGVLKN